MREILVKNDEFKDSPLGRIPKDWQVDKLVSRASVFGGKRLPLGHLYSDNPTKFRYLRVVDFFERDIDFEALEFLKPSTFKAIERYEIHKNNLFISIAGSLGYVGVFRTKYQQQRTILTENAARIVLHDDSLPEFVAYQMNNSVVQKQIEAEKGTGGGVPKLALFRIENLLLTFPPREEQEKIVAILQTLDEAIACTSSLIIKLKQTKAGLLQDLLTRGLDENGKLRDPQAHPEHFKDSLLGKIPKDWEVRTCESVCRKIVVGIVIKPSQYYKPSGIPMLRSANVREAGLDPSDLVFMSEQSNRILAKSMICTGDVLTVRTGYPGTSCVVPPDFDGANCVDIIISRPSAEIDSAFLATWINSDSGKGQVLRVQGGLAQQHFNVGELQKLLIAKPSIEEQREIQTILYSHDTRICQEQVYLNKLKLQKQGLMQDLLTGKVRVKNII